MDCIHSFPIDLKLNGVPNWFRIGRKMVNALRFADSGGSTLGFLVRSLTINFSLRRFFFFLFSMIEFRVTFGFCGYVLKKDLFSSVTLSGRFKSRGLG